jgi:hypothetical protein
MNHLKLFEEMNFKFDDADWTESHFGIMDVMKKL